MIECISCSAHMLKRFPGQPSRHWRCPKCGLECIDPQPDDRTLAEIYDKLYFSHYTSATNPEVVREMKRATYGQQLSKLPAVACFPAQRRLLDCGAATGFFVELAKERGWDAFAVEISEFGSQCCATLLGQDRVFCGQVEQAMFASNPDAQFEVITMFDFLEHVRSPKDVLSWARHRLSAGGTLLLTTPKVGGLSWRLMGGHWFHYVREHLWFFSGPSIQALLREAGFETVNVYPLRKAIALDYALAHYLRSNSYNRLFSPVARVLHAVLPTRIKRLRVWFYLGEMVVVACAGK